MKSKVKIRKVSSHYAIDGVISETSCDIKPDPKLPVSAKKFWIRCAFTDSCEAGVVAFDGKKLVGFFRYSKGFGCMSFQGTWVDPAYRNQGIAKAMITSVLKTLPQGSGVLALPISSNGSKMVKSLSKLYPSLNWDVSEVV